MHTTFWHFHMAVGRAEEENEDEERNAWKMRDGAVWKATGTTNLIVSNY